MIRVQHTVTLTLLIAIAAAVVAFPSPEPERVVSRDSPQLRVLAADTRARHASELLRREDSRRAAVAAAARAVKERSSLVYVSEPGVTPSLANIVKTLADNAFGNLARRDSTVRNVVVVVADFDGYIGGIPVSSTRSSIMSADAFPPGTVDPHLCITVVRAHYSGLLTPRTYRFDPDQWKETFAACQWYAEFGVPGRGVASWLDSTRFAPIEGYQYAAWAWLSPWSGLARYEEAHDIWMAADPSRLVITSCREGNDGACEKLLFSNIEEANAAAGAQIRTHDWTGSGRYYAVARNQNAGTLLQTLRVDLGAEQFAALWKSDLTMSQAFHSLRGESLTGWIRSQATTAAPLRRTHAFPSLATLIALLAGIAIPLFLGTRAVARRSGFA